MISCYSVLIMQGIVRIPAVVIMPELMVENRLGYCKCSITAGTHNFTLVYDKDYSVSEGSDAGWIDNVRFSPYSGQNWRFFTNATERLNGCL